jgi:hypothetical protein
MSDRGDYRAHKYEGGPKSAGAMLSLAEVTTELEFCQQVIEDVRALATNSSFAALQYKAAGSLKDDRAEDVVDLILLGTVNWIVQYGPVFEHPAEARYFWQKREAYYEMLHREHDRRGDPGASFNVKGADRAAAVGR